MLTHVEFRSDLFPPVEGEDEMVNPGLWGKRLAEFLCEKLRAQGIETKPPIAEDWGWVLPIVNKDFDLWIGCGHYQEYPDGYLCFIETHTPHVRRFFRKVDVRARVESLQRAMDRVLSQTPGIESRRWWSYEEFSNPSRSSP